MGSDSEDKVAGGALFLGTVSGLPLPHQFWPKEEDKIEKKKTAATTSLGSYSLMELPRILTLNFTQ